MTDLSVDLSDPETYRGGIPYDVFDGLRATDPVSWRSEPGGRGFWAVTRYADVLEVLKNPQIYSSWLGSALISDPPPEFLEKLRESIMHRDPPDHTRMRRVVNKAFTPKRLAELEGRIAEHARRLVSRHLQAGHCDFARDIAGEMPLFVICEILGVPLADRTRLYALTERMFGTDLVDRAAAMRDTMAAADEMRAYGAELGLRKRRDPGDDLVSDLLSAEVDGRMLTDGEFRAFFMLLFNAGADTTRSLLCFGLNLLLERPDLLARLRAEPSLQPKAIEEMLRYEPPVIQFRRTATQPTVLSGRPIAEGDKVVVFFPAANRDPDVFPEPHRFDIERTPNNHLSFGIGTHYCLGAPLARLEARHLFFELLANVRDLEKAGDLVTTRTNFVRTVRHLPVRFRAA